MPSDLSEHSDSYSSPLVTPNRLSDHLAHSEPDVVRCLATTHLTSNGTRHPSGGTNVTKSESVDIDKDEGKLGVEGDPARRLSQGDAPLWLEKDELNFLLGRALNGRKIRLTEVAPTHSSIRDGNVEQSGWKIPLDVFSSKKQTNMRHRSRRVKSYYKAQDELITAFEDIALEVEYEISTNNSEDLLKQAYFFSKLTLLINVLLFVAKGVASALSGSIAIISSLVDSFLDLLSGFIMSWATRAMRHRDPYMYPQGKTKLQPIAVIILSVVMTLCSIQLVFESVKKIVSLTQMNTSLPNVDVITFAIAGSTVVVKLILWLVCRKIQSPVIQALAQDHRNDVLSNLVAIVCGYLGSQNFRDIVKEYGYAYVDPSGAILISIYIMFNWWQTGKEQIKMLTGHTARPDFLSKLTWISVNHHEQICHIDTVRAFHFGCNFLVEVDIVLPGDMQLRQAHDIGESLQHRLESLPEVERAFVHLDYEFTHNPKSEHKIV